MDAGKIKDAKDTKIHQRIEWKRESRVTDRSVRGTHKCPIYGNAIDGRNHDYWSGKGTESN